MCSSGGIASVYIYAGALIYSSIPSGVKFLRAVVEVVKH